MSSDDEDHRSDDHTKNPEEGVDAAVKRRGVWVGFGSHGELKMLFDRECNRVG